MASKTAGSFENVSKVVETISKRIIATDVENHKNTLLENANMQDTFYTLKLMAIVYESLRACRNNTSTTIGLKSIDKDGNTDLCNADSVTLSKAINSVHKEYNAVVGFRKTFTRLVTDEEQNKVNRLFKGCYELIKFSKRATQRDSYLYRSYYGLIELSKRFVIPRSAEERNENTNDADVRSNYISRLGSINELTYNMIDLATVRKALYSIYSYSTSWTTSENMGVVLQKSWDAQSYILENATILFRSAAALKDVDREGYNEFYQDFRQYLSSSIFADLSMIVNPTCLVKTIHALAEAYLKKTGEERISYSTTSILLDATSMLLEMFSLRSVETDKFMKWLKQCTYIADIEIFLAMVFIQLLFIIMDAYTKNGKTMEDLLNDRRSMVATIGTTVVTSGASTRYSH